jgi:hypothetical protein
MGVWSAQLRDRLTTSVRVMVKIGSTMLRSYATFGEQ